MTNILALKFILNFLASLVNSLFLLDFKWPLRNTKIQVILLNKANYGKLWQVESVVEGKVESHTHATQLYNGTCNGHETRAGR